MTAFDFLNQHWGELSMAFWVVFVVWVATK